MKRWEIGAPEGKGAGGGPRSVTSPRSSRTRIDKSPASADHPAKLKSQLLFKAHSPPEGDNGSAASVLHRLVPPADVLAPVIAAPACRLWPAAGPSGPELARGPTPRPASPGPRAADQGAAREEICRLRWRAGGPLSPRPARRRGGQLSARPRYNRATFVQQGRGAWPRRRHGLRAAVARRTAIIRARVAIPAVAYAGLGSISSRGPSERKR